MSIFNYEIVISDYIIMQKWPTIVMKTYNYCNNFYKISKIKKYCFQLPYLTIYHKI